MIRLSSLELNNIVLVDERLTGTKEILRGSVVEIRRDMVVVEVITNEEKVIKIVSDSNKIYPIPLGESELLGLGFSHRSLNTSLEVKKDLVKSIEIGNGDWYLLELMDSFLTIKRRGIEVLGCGKITSLHHLQNLVNQITNGEIKIK